MRKTVASVVLAACCVLVASPRPASAAPPTFTLYGEGNGHGVGMGQYGAYGLALKGWDHNRILARFYQGTSLGRPSFLPSQIRVGLLQHLQHIHVKAQGGTVYLRLGSLSGTVIARIPDGETWMVSVAGNHQYFVRRQDGTLVGNRGYGSASSLLFGTYQSSGASAYVTEAFHTYGRGWFEFNIYFPCSGCDHQLRLINQLGLEGYLYGLGEVPSEWPMETLKAQAIAGRSFAIARVDLFGQHRDVCNCGVYSTTRDQAYVGSDKERGQSGDRWVEAVDSTANVAVLSAGKAIPAYYGAADAGHTEHIENVWGGSPVSYLRGVCDPGDYSPANPYTSWTVTMSGAVVGDKLAAATGQDVGDVLSFTNAARGVSGRIISIQANGTSGSMTVPGGTFESALGLRERVVWINENRIITGWIRNEYDWTNCKPGLPASPGFYVSGGRYQSFQDGRIYANFAREHAYWVHGAVLTKYQGLGAHAGFLKLPVSRQFALANGLDFRQDFQGGRIYWSSRTGAHELHGRVLSYWVSLRGNESSLGMPVTDVTTTATNQSATFEFGTVTCNLSTGACTDTGMTPQFA